MRKIWIFIILLIVGAVFVAVYFWAIPSAEPKLRVEFNDPWHTRPGQTFELDIKIVNDAQESAAKNVQALVLAPENFTISRTGTSECNLNFGMLSGGEAVNDTLVLAAPYNALPRDYTITVRVWAQNVPEETFNPQVTVELPVSFSGTPEAEGSLLFINFVKHREVVKVCEKCQVAWGELDLKTMEPFVEKGVTNNRG